MNNHILVFPRYQFKKLVANLNQDQLETMAFISIHEPITVSGKELFGGASETILDSADNVLNLWFDDAEEQLPIIGQPEQKLILFDEDMAKKVIAFVKANEEAEGWILHCTMGKNRSGAIGDFLCDYFGIDYFEFKRHNPQISPNVLVKNILKKVLNNLEN